MVLHRFLAWFTLGLVFVAGAVIWLVPPVEDFQPDNPYWNGTRHFAEVTGVTPVGSFAELPDLPKEATLIVIPYRQFDSSELAALGGFVSDGGVLVLADDFGWGNQVLENFGLESRFSRDVLLDPLFRYKSRWFPQADVSGDDHFTTGLKHFTLNYATTIVEVAQESVLATSSSFSFLDRNVSESQDEGEPVGRQAVMSRQAFGRGQVVLLSDPSVFINSMLSGDNLKLAENVAAASKAGLYFDRSHLATSNLRAAKDGLHAARDFASRPPVLVTLVLGVLALVLVPVWRKENNL